MFVISGCFKSFKGCRGLLWQETADSKVGAQTGGGLLNIPLGPPPEMISDVWRSRQASVASYGATVVEVIGFEYKAINM